MARIGVSRLSLGCVVACIAGLVALLTAPLAVAGEPGPLQITKFTLQTTARTNESIAFIDGDGVTHFEFFNEPYSPAFTQAGGHPWALTTAIEFANQTNPGIPGARSPTRDVKDIIGTIPVGLIGNPMAVARCPLAIATGRSDEQCPNDTQVGSYTLHYFEGKEVVGPIANVAPEAGQSAEFQLENTAKGAFAQLITAHLVRTREATSGGLTRERYGLELASKGIPRVGLIDIELTFWGVPADPSHDPLRGRFCQGATASQAPTCTGGFTASGLGAVPFLSLPTACSAGPEISALRADSWLEPGTVVGGRYAGYAEASASMPGVTGCNLLKFEPTIEVQPDTLQADAPVGLGVTIKVPQPEQAGVNATPHLRDAVVTLPAGMSISPGVVDGIQACDAFGPEGINMGRAPSGPDESEELGVDGELQLAPGRCPDASTVGTAEAITPLLPEPVKGHVYLARPGCGNAALGQAACTEQDALDGNLYKLYLELGGTGQFANTGVNIKVPGFVEANPATGQLTTKFLDNPQLPFSELKIHLNGGPRAPLDNPAQCGPAVTAADFTPWSAPGTTPEGVFMAGDADATPSSFFNVDLAGDGLATPCPSLPFAPGFAAGTASPQAGQFSSFTMNLTRPDRQQFIKGVQVHTPPGLLAMLASVPLCPESQANDPAVYGECTASKIGTTRVASGAGSHPFEIEGDVYLTGPHGGAPFGLSIVTHAVAGPFNLGLVVVRARIDIDPTDSTATITTDETGPHKLPQIVFGVPLRLKQVTVNIDRPGFMFNPTSCKAQQVTAAISGSQNAVANVSSPFAAGACKSLAFKPSFTVSTSGHTSKANGASLDARVTYPAGSVGSEANIAYVKVELPKQLPSRLSTLQKACLAVTFDANPAACPPGSLIGVVRSSTPLLPVPLTGPVYFVSHGSKEFPSLVAVLQGDGVRVNLTGATFINGKTGITSSTFKTVPDVPISSFELYLPEGPYSALAANANLCSLTATTTVKHRVTRRVRGRIVHKTVTSNVTTPATLNMPTEFIAQNGAVMKKTTKIAVTGCTATKAKAFRRHAKHNRRTGR
jgi:hypothetical protein